MSVYKKHLSQHMRSWYLKHCRTSNERVSRHTGDVTDCSHKGWMIETLTKLYTSSTTGYAGMGIIITLVGSN